MPHPTVRGNRIGPRLRKAREKAGMEQVELSASLSVDHHIELSQATISLIESGKRTVRDKEIYALCIILEISADWLLGLKD